MQMEYINTWENKLFLSLPGTGVGGGWRLVGGLSAKILVFISAALWGGKCVSNSS